MRFPLMVKQRFLTFLLICMLYSFPSIAGIADSVSYNISNTSTLSDGKFAPYWLQTNRAGTIAAQPYSNTLRMGISKEINNHKKLSFGYGLNLLYQAAPSHSKAYIHECYTEGRLGFFNLFVGAKEQSFGNQFEPLSSGGFIFSGNTRPIPMAMLYMPNYTAIPYTYGLIEIKGTIQYANLYNDRTEVKNTLLHYKNAFIRLGGKLPIRINFGLHHAAQWGGESPTFGKLGTSLKDFYEIVLIKSGGTNDPIYDQINKKGNHIISQNLGIDIRFFSFTFNTYWQNINEDPPVNLLVKEFKFNFPNRPDMLLGFSLSNPKIPFVQNILFEYFNSTDQSGPYHDKDGIIYGGNDSYFQNWLYPQGYTYFGRTIGTPLITSPLMNYNGNTSGIQNNRVKAYHFGLRGAFKQISYKFLKTHSKNYGSNPVNVTNINNYMVNDSYYAEVSSSIKKYPGIQIMSAIGFDQGKLFGNSFGFQLGIKYTGFFK